MKYIVKDWAGNVMNWGEFSEFEYAGEAISNHVLGEMSEEGYKLDWLEKNEGELTEEDLEDERTYYEWCGEYDIHEIEEGMQL